MHGAIEDHDPMVRSPIPAEARGFEPIAHRIVRGDVTARTLQHPMIEEYLNMLDEHLDKPWWALRLTYGLVPIVAGLDKFTNLLTDWTQYLSPIGERVLPFSASTFMHIVGIIEIVAGILVLTRWTRIGAYIVGAWLIAIALNLVT